MTPTLRSWIYHRTAPGQLHLLSHATYDAWNIGKRKIDPAADGFVWLVFIEVWMVSRRAVKVHAVHCVKSRVTAKGVHTEKMRSEEMNAALRSVWAFMDGKMATARGEESSSPAAENAVIDASHRFAKARYRWKPTAADVEAIRAVILRRAKSPLPLPL